MWTHDWWSQSYLNFLWEKKWIEAIQNLLEIEKEVVCELASVYKMQQTD